MTAEHDSRLLKAAPSNSDDWDDATWAAWCRHVDRVHQDRSQRFDQLVAENVELQAKLDTAERQLQRLDGELVRLRDENRELTRAFGLNEAPEVAA
ncbi:MAG TPA: hypothetical protein VIP28_12540 [Nocardioides sp.]